MKQKIIEITAFLVFASILGSIGFVFMEYQNVGKRNARRIMDISYIQSPINIQLAQGQSILSFVTDNIDNQIDFKKLFLGGRKNTITGEYNAGIYNGMACPPHVCDGFIDPLTETSYAIGVTTTDNGKYEIAASMEQYKGNHYALVSGSYKPRIQTEINCSKVLDKNNEINIDSNYKDAFYPGDYVVVKTNSGEINEVINLVSSDGLTITLSGEVNNPISIRLAESESIGLIDRKDADGSSGNNFVTNSGMNLPY